VAASIGDNPERDARSQALGAVVAGLVTAVVGFSSSFALVLTGLTAQGGTTEQAASGLFILCLAMAVGMALLIFRHRIPITLAWSTPGAALLAGTSMAAENWSAAVGAFVLVAS